jgi:hypothetical protein
MPTTLLIPTLFIASLITINAFIPSTAPPLQYSALFEFKIHSTLQTPFPCKRPKDINDLSNMTIASVEITFQCWPSPSRVDCETSFGQLDELESELHFNSSTQPELVKLYHATRSSQAENSR